MLISEVIEQLEAVQLEHGDVEVRKTVDDEYHQSIDDLKVESNLVFDNKKFVTLR